MNIKNLTKLADYLDALPDDYDHFEMSEFFLGPSNTGYTDFSCGTVACAIGHGPAAGLPLTPADLDSVNKPRWGAYSEWVTGVAVLSREWDWLFSAAWWEYDNTPKGAAARIRYLIQHREVPEEFTSPSAVLLYQS